MKVGGETGENPDQVIQRGSASLQEVSIVQAEHIAIVAHSNFNKIMLAKISGIGVGRMFEIEQANCCINVIDIHAENAQHNVVAINIIDHLEGDCNAKL